MLCSGLACSVCKERSEFKNFEPLIKGFSSKFPNYFIIIFYFFSIFYQNHAIFLLFGLNSHLAVFLFCCLFRLSVYSLQPDIVPFYNSGSNLYYHPARFRIYISRNSMPPDYSLLISEEVAHAFFGICTTLLTVLCQFSVLIFSKKSYF